jgi:uncharacterized protein
MIASGVSPAGTTARLAARNEEAVVVPPTLTYPGVYLQELPSAVQPIVGVPTSVAAFYGRAPQGQVDYPYQVNSWADYENEFGGLDTSYPLSYAVYLFFVNGGATALVVRYNDPNVLTASAQLSGDITLDASSPGDWGTQLQAEIDYENLLNPEVNLFNLTITQKQGSTVVAQEVYPGASLTKGNAQYLPTLLMASQLVTPAAGNGWTQKPAATADLAFTFPAGGAAGAGAAGATGGAAGGGSAGAAGGGAAGGGAAGAGGGAAGAQPTGGAGDTGGPLPTLGDQGQKTGIYALLKADIFNILCLPVDPLTTYDAQTLSDAAEFCATYRAMLIVDPPLDWTNIPPPLQFPTITGSPALSPASANAATYYPNLVLTDSTGATFNVGPCGAVAGVWAATDNNRGVWKAPAGTAATITGITGFTAQVDDGESGTINPLAVNGLRMMPVVGPVVWGARTTVGADQSPNQWKYIPVRRLALYIEESLRRGMQWAVFEPNDEPLWSSLRLNVTTFMQGLFRQGAFAGTTPAQAYLVQCDANNNPPDQVALGIVNVLVGFAPLYPAEFVIINIQQQAGQAST